MPTGRRRERHTRTFKIHQETDVSVGRTATWYRVVESFWKVIDYFDPVTRTYYGRSRTLDYTIEHPWWTQKGEAEEEMRVMSHEAATNERADDDYDQI